jgi:hypothetical protein
MVLQKGPRARWKRRWMKLEGGKLYIFKNDIVRFCSSSRKMRLLLLLCPDTPHCDV